MNKINKQVGNRIRALRQKRELSQELLADSSGVHRSHIGKIERGEIDVSFATLYKIGTGLRVPLAELLKGIGMNRAG